MRLYRIEPTPLVYALSVIVPLDPLAPTFADQVRWSVIALAGAVANVRSMVSAVRIAMPRRRVGRMGPFPVGSVDRAIVSSRAARVASAKASPQGEQDGSR